MPGLHRSAASNSTSAGTQKAPVRRWFNDTYVRIGGSFHSCAFAMQDTPAAPHLSLHALKRGRTSAMREKPSYYVGQHKPITAPRLRYIGGANSSDPETGQYALSSTLPAYTAKISQRGAIFRLRFLPAATSVFVSRAFTRCRSRKTGASERSSISQTPGTCAVEDRHRV
jgi:hypothetical protein